MRAILILATLALAGCATDPAVTDKLISHQMAQQARATLSITCPETGCQFRTLDYTDPRDRGQVKLPTNGWDAAKSIAKDVLTTATSIAPWWAVTTVATHGIKGAGHDQISTTSTTTTTNTTSSSSSVVDDHSSVSTTTSTTDSGNTTSTETVTTDNSFTSTDNSVTTAP